MGTTLFGISKTTLNGWLAGIIAIAGPFTAYLAAQNSHTATVISGVVTLIATIARVLVGILQGDAPLPPPNLSSTIPPK